MAYPSEMSSGYLAKRKVPDMNTPRFYTVDQAADVLGFSASTLRELLWSGELAYYQRGKRGRIRIAVDELDRFIKANTRREGEAAPPARN